MHLLEDFKRLPRPGGEPGIFLGFSFIFSLKSRWIATPMDVQALGLTAGHWNSGNRSRCWISLSTGNHLGPNRTSQKGPKPEMKVCYDNEPLGWKIAGLTPGVGKSFSNLHQISTTSCLPSITRKWCTYLFPIYMWVVWSELNKLSIHKFIFWWWKMCTLQEWPSGCVQKKLDKIKSHQHLIDLSLGS